MSKMTKQETREIRKAWPIAVAEGRVVRYNGGLTFTAFPTVALAEEFLETLRRAGLTGEIAKPREAAS